MHIFDYVIFFCKSFTWVQLLLVICFCTQFLTFTTSDLYLLCYVETVAILTTVVSFVVVQNFLHQNKPLNLQIKLFNFKREDFNTVTSIKQLTLDIDKLFIEKWFVHISKDPSFNNESQFILEKILRKIVKVQLSLDNKAIIKRVLHLYLKHLKEFQRSLKSRDFYKYSHPCSASKEAKDHFIHQLTINLLNHFVSWELANSFPYQVLVSVISNQVMTHILNLLSNPEFINYYILRSCAPESRKFNDFNRVKIIQNTKTPLIQTQKFERGTRKPEHEEVPNLGRIRTKHRKFTESSLATPSLSDMLDKILLEDDETKDVMSNILESCAKAVMRVVDKIIIALSGNSTEGETFDGLKSWLFKLEANNCDFYERVTKFLENKKVFYETADFFEYVQQNSKLCRFDDEFYDFTITKTLFDILCELLADNKETSLTKEPVIQSILLLFGNCIEENVVTQANYYLRYFCANAKIPSENQIETLSMDLEEFVSVVLSGIPDSVKCLVGENTLKGAISLFISSLQIGEINQDILLQIFEILCFKLIEGVINYRQ